jgi:hypothetical protein
MFRTVCSCCFIAVGVVALTSGCSGSNPTGASSEATSAASEALTIIKHCQVDSSKCEADAGDAGRLGCDDKYRACLGIFSSDGGTSFRYDGGGFPFDDAGVPHPEPKDAGKHFDDDFAKIESCIDNLHTCIEAKTAPDTCADDAVDCIEEVLVPSTGSSGASTSGSTSSGLPGSSGYGSGRFVFLPPPPHGSSWSFVFPFPLEDGGVFPFPHHDGGRP